MTPLYRVLYYFYRLVSGRWHWVQRHFTRPGLAVLGTLILAALLAPDTDNNLTYQALPLLLFLLVVAVCLSWLFKAPFSATRLLPRFGTAGYPLHYRVGVRNFSTRVQNGLTLLENLADSRPSFEAWMAVQRAEQKLLRSFRFSGHRPLNPFKVAVVKDADVPPIPPGLEMEVRVELKPLRRGVLRFTGVTLARTDPLGLFRALTTMPLPQTVLILPKRYPLPAIALPGTVKYQEGGVALAASVGQSEEYVALRDYRHGDPLRHIHWRSWARVGRPVVKEFQDEFFVRHALVLGSIRSPTNNKAKYSKRRCRSRLRSPAPCRPRNRCSTCCSSVPSPTASPPDAGLRTWTRCWRFWRRCAPVRINPSARWSTWCSATSKW
jgi:uncharacterized protein (DUF58 family)